MTAFWHLITRFGETGVALPAALLVMGWLWRRAPSACLGWATALGTAIVLVTATKIAFMGFGHGIPALDFTGLSGHAMLSSAAYPLLGWAALSGRSRRWRTVGFSAGLLLALLVAISRVPVQAHSVSEVVSGTLLGLGVAMAGVHLARRHPPARPVPTAFLGLLALWCALVLGMRPDPVVPSHEIVTRLALAMSGRPHPYTRSTLHGSDASGPHARPAHRG